MKYQWSLFNPDFKPKEQWLLNLGTYAILVLNRPIEIDPDPVLQLWNRATVRQTADGGTDRWLNFVRSNNLLPINFMPDLVTGDFDSITPETLSLIKQTKTTVEETPDQNETDFTKALRVLNLRVPKLDSVVILTDHSGRIDHIFSTLNTLNTASEIFGNKEVKSYILAPGSLTWLLPPGEHVIAIPKSLRTIKNWCGILPFSPKRSKVFSKGLQWNLDGQSIEFGGLISSSNTYDGSPEVEIVTDAHLLWCMGIGEEPAP